MLFTCKSHLAGILLSAYMLLGYLSPAVATSVSDEIPAGGVELGISEYTAIGNKGEVDDEKFKVYKNVFDSFHDKKR